MCEAKFTWLPKFTNTLLSVPEEHQAALFRALAQYGNFGIEPDFGDDWALRAVFESLREDIDNNKRFRSNGSSGGRGNKKGDGEGVSNPETPLCESETPLSDTENPPLDVCEGGETPLCEVGETQKGGSDFAPSIPYQSIPNHTKPTQAKGVRRFRAPTTEEVEEYAADYAEAKGLDPGGFSAERFIDYYTSNGWKVGRNPMKDWKAAARDWVRRDCKEVGGDVYSRL